MISLFLYGLYLAWPVIAALLVIILVCNCFGRKTRVHGVLFPVAPMKNRAMWMTSDEFNRVYPGKSYKAYIRRSERKHWR